jgi:hypothetical protein
MSSNPLRARSTRRPGGGSATAPPGHASTAATVPQRWARWLVRAPRLAALSCVASLAGAMPQSATVDESAFFVPLDELALYGDGAALDFRCRALHYDDRALDAAPSVARDGIVRVRCEGPALTMDETFVELTSEDAHQPIPRRVRSYHSLAAGEYVRAFSLPGGGRDSAIVDRWEGVPPIYYFAQGVLAARAMLADAVLVERVPRDGSIQSATYASSDGRRWTVTYDAASPGTMLTLESRAANGAFADWVFFEGHRENAAGLPRRPALVTHARIDSAGRTASVSVWQAIERTDAPAADAWRLAPGTRVEDLRNASAEGSGVVTDRPLELVDLLTWPGSAGAPYPASMIEVEEGELRRLAGPHAATRGFPRSALAALLLGIVGTLWWRSRRLRSS